MKSSADASSSSTSSSSFSLSSLSQEETLQLLRKRLPRVQRSLSAVVVSLIGSSLLVELKNDVEVSGVLEEADENMNMTLQQAVQVFPSGIVRELEVVFVSGSLVRYVHIPPQINAVKHLNEHAVKLKRISAGNRQSKMKSKK